MGREMMSVKGGMIKGRALIPVLSAIVLCLSLWAGAMEKPKTSADVTASPGAGAAPELSAALSDAEKKAHEQTATVEVEVVGIQLIDPGAVKEQPQPGQGHIHYQLDNGPIIATTSTKLSFHELSSGPHKITVMLAGNDHQPLGPQETLTVNIPPGKAGSAQR
jgi:hypothetical protein